MFRFRSDTEDDLSSGSGQIRRIFVFRFWSDTEDDLCSGTGRIQRMI